MQKTVLDVQSGIYTLNANIGGVDKPLAYISRFDAVQKYEFVPCLTPTTAAITDSYYWQEVNNQPAASNVEYDFQNPISFETYINEHYIAPEGWSFAFSDGNEDSNPTIKGTL